MLEYDNSAFYYFAITMMMFYLLPGTYYTVIYVKDSLFQTKDPKELGRTSLEKQKEAKMKAEKSGSKRLISVGFILHFIFLVVMWATFFYLVKLVKENHEIASFDPFRILGIEQGAEQTDIRRAYRRLSLEFHPDKNPGNSHAADMFMKVAKAHEALTDETARKNWEEFGNPDGKQALEVSIGLPTFLLDENNHQIILIIYLICMVVITPILVGCWYNNSKKYGENNVMYETYSFFLRALSEHSTTKMLCEVLAGAAEFRTINAPLTDKSKIEDVQRLMKKTRELGMNKPRFEHAVVLKGNLLLHAHVFTSQLDAPLPAYLQADLDAMLAKSVKLLDAMLELAQSQRWIQTIINIIEFHQCMAQGLWVKDHSLMQLPHFTEKEVMHCIKGKGAVKSIAQYLKQDDDQKKGLARMSDQQRIDVMRVCEIIPNLDIAVRLYVEDEEQIAEKDLVTLEVSFTRLNLKEGEKAAPAHAPHFVGIREEVWYVLLLDKNNSLIAVDKVINPNREFKHNLKFLAPPTAGTYAFNVEVKSECYMGLDTRHTCKMEVTPAAELPAYEPHPDDVELDNEPTLFEQVMAGAQDDSDSEEEEGENEDEPNGEALESDPSMSHLSAADRRRRVNRIKRKQQDKTKDGDDKDDDDDDDDDDDGVDADGDKDGDDDDDDEEDDEDK